MQKLIPLSERLSEHRRKASAAGKVAKVRNYKAKRLATAKMVAAEKIRAGGLIAEWFKACQAPEEMNCPARQPERPRI